MNDAQGNSSGDDVVARVELGLAQLLRRAERTGASTAPRGQHADLDRSGYLLLYALQVRGPRRVHELAEHLGIDASTATRQVVALERAGHVQRTRDPQDGRAVVVAATPGGRDALGAQRRQRHATYETVLDGWDAADRTRLADLVERLNADLDSFKRST